MSTLNTEIQAISKDDISRSTNISFTEHSSNVLNTQKQFDQFGFPFTLNPTVGCSFVCKFCYSPIFVAKVKTGKRKQFFENIRVKLDVPELLDSQLEKLKNLPQYLKRVQINETSDYYLPRVVKGLQNMNRDIMLEILHVFQKHAENGNVWMLHVLTKSNLILNHLPIYKEMRNMVQIEVSFTTHDENIRKQLEFFTIPTTERLKVVGTLAKNDVFVRIMAMPFYGGAEDLQILKDLTFSAGATAFKNKGLNYFDWDELKSLSYSDLINDRITRVNGRPDVKDLNLMIKSGEDFLVNDQPQEIELVMPNPRDGRERLRDWAVPSKFEERLTRRTVKLIDCGYSQISTIDWGYIR